MSPDDVLGFFYGKDPPDSFATLRDWIVSMNPSRDGEVRERFGPTIEEAFTGGLADWEETDDGQLALLLVVDQFPRHAFRGTARQYDGDCRGYGLALKMLTSGATERLRHERAMSILMALGHCEIPEQHEANVALADAHAERCPDWWGPVAGIGPSQSRKYREIIRRFGRFPHRNEILGRSNTADEERWLKLGGASQMPPDVIRDGSLFTHQT
jgi:uncharacterized protein (DUF924 family)